MFKAPAFLFPSYTVFVDDDLLYPQVITSDIPDCPPIATVNNFDFILKQKDKDFLFLDEHVHRSSSEVFTTLYSDLNKKACSLTDLISVLIVDLNMEGASGLELLGQIRSPFIYKVLISNYIGKSEDAVRQAQNTGVIDEVIEKGKHLIETLPKTIRRGQTKFFTALSEHMFAGRESHNYLADTYVANKYLELIDRFEPHTIWPEPDLASFTLSNRQESPSRIFFTTKSEIDALIACYDPSQIPNQTLRRLKNGQYIICHKNPHTLDIEEWPYYLRR